MKKALIAVWLVTALSLAVPAEARAEILSLNFGVITDSSFSFKPFLWTAGMTVDIPLGNTFTLCPEGYVVVNKFDFGSFIFAPAVMLNVNFKEFFAGAGVSKWFLLGNDVEGSPSTDFSLKLNAGFQGCSLRLCAFIFTPFNDLFKSMAVGATLGFVF
ncbi:MAG: hypothetical protein ACYDH3_06025 [Candidatus Aminicenantales bacterium]